MTNKQIESELRKLNRKICCVAANTTTTTPPPTPTIWGLVTGDLSDQTDLQNALNAKQAALVSGTSIKTINSTSVLGAGNIAVQPTLVSATNIKTINGATILGAGDLVVAAGASALDDLTDVSGTTAAPDGKILKKVAGVWTAADEAGGGGGNYVSTMYKEADGDMVAGSFTFTNASLINATQLVYIIVNKVIEFLGEDFSFNSGTGTITRTNQWQPNDVLVVPYKSV